mmetsp:Transcript_34652/g.101850  ORF Transcript_34652/g.101850 Transcript_34652/m.101850 type:complete len:279 (-) Transcript_34652:25-861(-)
MRIRKVLGTLHEGLGQSAFKILVGVRLPAVRTMLPGLGKRAHANLRPSLRLLEELLALLRGIFNDARGVVPGRVSAAGAGANEAPPAFVRVLLEADPTRRILRGRHRRRNVCHSQGRHGGSSGVGSVLPVMHSSSTCSMCSTASTRRPLPAWNDRMGKRKRLKYAIASDWGTSRAGPKRPVRRSSETISQGRAARLARSPYLSPCLLLPTAACGQTTTGRTAAAAAVDFCMPFAASAPKIEAADCSIFGALLDFPKTLELHVPRTCSVLDLLRSRIST